MITIRHLRPAAPQKPPIIPKKDMGRPPRDFWNPERIARLREMIEIQGFSFSQAGAALGCGKNACIGKYSRLTVWGPR